MIDELGLGTGVLMAPAGVQEILHVQSEEKDVSHIWLITSSSETGELSFRAGFAWAFGSGWTGGGKW